MNVKELVIMREQMRAIWQRQEPAPPELLHEWSETIAPQPSDAPVPNFGPLGCLPNPGEVFAPKVWATLLIYPSDDDERAAFMATSDSWRILVGEGFPVAVVVDDLELAQATATRLNMTVEMVETLAIVVVQGASEVEVPHLKMEQE